MAVMLCTLRDRGFPKLAKEGKKEVNSDSIELYMLPRRRPAGCVAGA